MRQGAVITGEISNWQILQRDRDGFARARVTGWFFVSGLDTGTPMRVQCRVVREDDNSDVIPWADCVVDGLNFYLPLKIPQGGLYRLETKLVYDGANGLSVTRGDMVQHFGVGDIYLITGQSNAAGRYQGPVSDPPRLGVHALKPGGVWDLATHPLHETTCAVLTPSMENNNPGHSAFLAFGKRMQAALGVPVGLVPLAKGGAGLWQWDPDEEAGLFKQAVDVIHRHCPKVAGALWYQGCADSFEKKGDTYLMRFGRYVDALRDALGQPALPFYTVQINRCTMETTPENDISWGKVREAQRRAALTIPGVRVTASTDLAIFDAAHLDGESNVRLGGRLAEMALAPEGSAQWSPAVRARRDAQDAALVHLLTCVPMQAGSGEGNPFTAEDGGGMVDASSYTCQGNAILIRFPRALAPGAKLHAQWQMNPASPPVSAEAEIPMMSFFDLPIEEDHA